MRVMATGTAIAKAAARLVIEVVAQAGRINRAAIATRTRIVRPEGRPAVGADRDNKYGGIKLLCGPY
jgi:hypothetical protein